jgi:hypothetical protein
MPQFFCDRSNFCLRASRPLNVRAMGRVLAPEQVLVSSSSELRWRQDMRFSCIKPLPVGEARFCLSGRWEAVVDDAGEAAFAAT